MNFHKCDDLCEVKVSSLPDCDICSHEKFITAMVEKAQYDGKTHAGPWAYMCDFHHG